MILQTRSGEFPIPIEVAERLPTVPPLPEVSAPADDERVREFQRWLDSSPKHVIDYERLRRWHLVQDELAASAKAEGRPFVVTEDGLE